MEFDNQSRQRRVGLVLSGGGARGFAHIGMLKAFEKTGIKADVVAGTSMGAIIGGLYAHGCTADEMYELAQGTSWRDVIDLSLQMGLIKGERLHTFLKEHLPEEFSDLKIPLVVSTTDIETGEQIYITEGDLVRAVRASSCFPGAFEPVQFNGRTLADGGIINNLPVEAVAFFNANYVIASDTTPPRRAAFQDPHQNENWWERMVATLRLERRNPMAHMIFRTSDIMQSILTSIQYTMHPADIRVEHPMPHIHMEAFWSLEEIVALGEQAALRTFKSAGLIEDAELTFNPPAALTEEEKKHPVKR